MSSSDTEEPNEVGSTPDYKSSPYLPQGTSSAPVPTPAASSGWTPTTSTVGGGVIGGAMAQLIVAFIESVAHVTLTSATTGAITTLAVVAAGYLFPDGGRK